MIEGRKLAAEPPGLPAAAPSSRLQDNRGALAKLLRFTSSACKVGVGAGRPGHVGPAFACSLHHEFVPSLHERRGPDLAVLVCGAHLHRMLPI